MKRKCIFVTVANLKGGVGKTTTVVNLAAALGRAGRKVLVIDLDFQGNATTGLGEQRNNPKSNVHAVLTGKISADEAIAPTPVDNVDVIGSHRSLLDYAKANNSAIGREYLFTDWRDDAVFKDYDVVLFDTHPDMDCLTLSALVASDCYVVPLFAELDPIMGLADMFQQIEMVKKRYNKTLSLLGVVITKFDKTESTHKRLEAKIRQGARHGNYHVFKSLIPVSKRLSSAKLMSRPVVCCEPSSTVAKAFVALAKEAVTRMKPATGAKKVSKPISFANVEKEIRAEAESSELI